MAMNTKKVLIGGFVAAVVMNVIDWLVNGVLLAGRMKAESDAFKPGLSDQMMSGSSIFGYIVMDIVLAFALVWTYAAIRPRFGPGIKTASYAALLFWVLTLIFMSGYMHMGMMSGGLWGMVAVFSLVNYLLSAWAGAKFYTENSTV
jgi:hypothetical protein